MPVVAAIIGATIVGGASYMASKEANSARKELARETNDQSIELANTAHQREVMDLRAAGLNPILSARGSGASTPSLQTPEVEVPDMSAAANTASSAYQAARTARLLDAQTATAEEGAFQAEQDSESKARDKAIADAHHKWLLSTDFGDPDYKPRNRQEALWHAEYLQQLGAPAQQAAQTGVLSNNIEVAREQVRKLMQDRAIGASAESRARIDDQINKSTYGQLSAWFKHFMSNVTEPIGDALGGARSFLRR